MSEKRKVGPNEKALLSAEITKIDAKIRYHEKAVADLAAKREAFELIRLAIWR